MSGARISAAEPRWTEADAAWEELQRRAAAGGSLARTCRAEALRLAQARGFGRPGDPRRATSLVHAASAADGEPRGELLRRACAAWTLALGWVDGMALPPRARSSLFHLRLEAKHPGAYAAAQRERLKARLLLARSWTEALARGDPLPPKPPAGRPEGLPPGDLRRLEAALAFLA